MLPTMVPSAPTQLCSTKAWKIRSRLTHQMYVTRPFNACFELHIFLPKYDLEDPKY